MRENGIEESIDRPLTIALVVDTVGNQATVPPIRPCNGLQNWSGKAIM